MSTGKARLLIHLCLHSCDKDNRLDTLRLRILDMLLEDEEQLEELFLDVNFQRRDNVLKCYMDRFRLTDVVLCLINLEKEGLIYSAPIKGYPLECGIAACMYRINETARPVCEILTRGREDRYILADDV